MVHRFPATIKDDDKLQLCILKENYVLSEPNIH